jgi:hypothetical protein
VCAGLALVYTEREDAWTAALPLIGRKDIDWWLPYVGAERDGDTFRRLFPDTVYHLAIPDGLLDPGTPLWHPTWARPDDPLRPPARTGGHSDATCPYCDDPQRRLLLLDPVPKDLGVAARRRLDLAYCHRCTGVEVSFHAHDEDGRPRLISAPEAVFPFQRRPMWPDTRVGLAQIGPRWTVQEFGDHRQNLTRLGGQPSWMQEPDHLRCPECEVTMRSLAQFDWTRLDGGDGMTYVGWCDDCAVSGFQYQQS